MIQILGRARACGCWRRSTPKSGVVIHSRGCWCTPHSAATAGHHKLLGRSVPCFQSLLASPATQIVLQYSVATTSSKLLLRCVGTCSPCFCPAFPGFFHSQALSPKPAGQPGAGRTEPYATGLHHLEDSPRAHGFRRDAGSRCRGAEDDRAASGLLAARSKCRKKVSKVRTIFEVRPMVRNHDLGLLVLLLGPPLLRICTSD